MTNPVAKCLGTAGWPAECGGREAGSPSPGSLKDAAPHLLISWGGVGGVGCGGLSQGVT